MDPKMCPTCNASLRRAIEKHAAFGRFLEWIKEAHPEIELTRWQSTMVRQIIGHPIGSGKSTIINLLHEYDRLRDRRG